MAKRNVERLEAYIYGIGAGHKVESVAVYKKGRSVRLSGPHGTHLVHRSNEGSTRGWMREVMLVWHLTNLISIPAELLGSESDKKKIEDLERKAAEGAAAATA